jgi:hypothetical protein
VPKEVLELTRWSQPGDLVSASFFKALSDVQAHADSLRKSARRLALLHERKR